MHFSISSSHSSNLTFTETLIEMKTRIFYKSLGKIIPTLLRIGRLVGTKKGENYDFMKPVLKMKEMIDISKSIPRTLELNLAM